MKKEAVQNIKLGALVFAGLLFFIVSIYILGKNQNMFSPVTSVSVLFEDVDGLQAGSIVRYSGINIGTVSSIKFISGNQVKVVMALENDAIKFIPTDSEVEIANDGLMGSKILIIRAGKETGKSIEEGHLFTSKKTISTDELLIEVKHILRSSSEITENLIAITSKINNGQGDFSNFINDDKLSTNLVESTDNLLKISSELALITSKINHGSGDLSALLNDNTLTNNTHQILNRVDSITQTTQLVADELLKLSRELNQGKGIVQKVAYDSVFAQKVDSTLTQLNSGLQTLESTAISVRESWIVNLFNQKKNK